MSPRPSGCPVPLQDLRRIGKVLNGTKTLNHDCVSHSKLGNQYEEKGMKKLFSVLVAAVFAIGSVSAIACGDKAKDEKQMSTPSKPKI